VVHGERLGQGQGQGQGREAGQGGGRRRRDGERRCSEKRVVGTRKSTGQISNITIYLRALAE
jgi:hypothetical protein